MGRTSKLFSSRKNSISSQASASASRESQYLSKAERLLGTTGLQDATRHQLPRRPSYISLTPSISEVGEEVQYDDFSSPDHFGLDPLPLRLANLQHNGSQDFLSRRTSSNASYTKSFVSEHSRRIKGSWSSATLQTHYEAGNCPPVRSQQGNASGRDRANPQVRQPEYRRPSTASVTSTAYDRKDSMDRATALPDMTRLHPKMAYPQSQSHYGASRSVNSPSLTETAAIASPRFPGAAPSSRPNTSAGSLRKAAGNATKSLKGHLSVDALPQSMKLFSRRSHVPPPVEHKNAPLPRRKKSNRNWWDNFQVDEDISDAESEHDPNLVTPTDALFPRSTHQVPSPRASDLRIPAGLRSDQSYGIRKVNSAQEIISARSSITLRSHQPAVSRESRPSSRMTANDLNERSVLSTSSSDTESEPDVDETDEPQTRNIRDSIAVSEIDVHHVGQAQALPLKAMRRIPESIPLDRRPSLASISSTPTADSSSIKSATQGPAYLSVPHRTNRNPRSGHTRQPSSIPEDSDNSSQVASPISPSASMRSFSAPQPDNRKLMAVTEEEEALLEMMRRKRADKAAQRDSGLASIKSSSTTKSTRPFSNLSGSSSILDSFPISRSQRSSLLASRAAAQQSPPETTSTPKEAERGRKRQSVQTTATDNSYYSIDSRLESPTRMKYAFTPHLSLASLDVSLAGLHSPSQDDASLSSPTALESPTTPSTQRGNSMAFVYEAGSKRNSNATYAHGDRSQANEESRREKLEEKTRRKTTSNATPRASPGFERPENPKNLGEAAQYTLGSSDEETSPKLDAEDSSSFGSSNRASTVSKNTSDCGSACGHAACSTNRRSVAGYGTNIGTRCSVSEDVLAAWGSLGGWREPPNVMG